MVISLSRASTEATGIGVSMTGLIKYMRHICDICGRKIKKDEPCLVSVSAFSMIHAYHLRQDGDDRVMLVELITNDDSDDTSLSFIK